jgi:anti-anti-sigma factor
MELKDGLLGDVPMVATIGSLDESTCGALEAALRERLEARFNIVFLDMSEVTFIDAAGVAVLKAWVRSLGGKGWLGVIGPNDEVRKTLETEELIPNGNVLMFEDRNEARMITGQRQST